jgi:hypothetical protein
MRLQKIIRRTIWALVALATLVAVFYAEEDWRGARNLRWAQDAYARAGRSLDFAKFIPAPVPDDENLAALPLFDLRQAPPLHPTPENHAPYLHPVELEIALEKVSPDWPRIGNYLDGRPADIRRVRQQVEAIYAANFPGAKPPSSALAQLEAVFPLLNELRNASVHRPLCRFKIDYQDLPLNDFGLPLLTDQIAVGKLLALHGVLALNENHPELALGDLRTLDVLASGAEQFPGIVGHLVAMGIRSIGESVIVEGLRLHAWNDAQLAQLQEELSRIDYLQDAGRAAESETAFSIALIESMKRHAGSDDSRRQDSGKGPTLHPVDAFSFWPVGWLDEAEAHLLSFQLTVRATTDPQSHRVYLERIAALPSFSEDGSAQTRFIAPDMLIGPAVQIFQRMTSQFARAAVAMDHSMIACALERFRLVHGNYPPTLEALGPPYLAAVPHDVIDGEPYRYRVLPDGSYLLYSIGSNGVDDGGTIVYQKQSPHQVDFDQGDWVWFGPKQAPVAAR